MPNIVTHWDADGIVSANKLLEKIEGEIFIPKIGVWRAHAIPQEALKGVVYVLDYALPKEDWARICSNVDELIVIDHHPTSSPPCGEVYNPALQGKDIPSASVVVSEYYLKIPLDWRDAVAIAGDLHDPRGDPLWERIVRRENINGEDTILAASLLNSCYKLLDYDCIKRYSRTLSSYTLKDLINDEYLLKKYERVRELLDKYVERAECEKVNGWKVCVIKGDERAMIMINSLWRRLKDGKTIVVVVTDDVHRIYCRGGNVDYLRLLDYLKGEILEKGGKKAVCSAKFRGDPWRVIEALTSSGL